MNCPECKNDMLDDYEDVGNGRLVQYGNIYDGTSSMVPSWYCAACHVVIVKTGDDDE
jgi:hypothetical protein